MKKLLSLITLLFIGSIAFSQITITSTVTNVSCFGGADGAIALSSSGGTAPYTYSWTPTLPSSPNVSNLSAGTYSVFILDAVANTNSLVVTIGQPSQLNAIVNANNVRCFGTSTGTVTASGIGGTAPYTYLWPAFPSTFATVPNIAVGNYSVIVTDANGCVTGNSVIVSQPTQLIGIITTTNVSCNGACNGAINIIAMGSTAPYTFSTTSGSSFSNNIINQCVGTQTVTITDPNNCVLMIPVTITQASSVTVVMTATNSNCGQSNGALCASVNGGTGALNYQWSNGNTLSCNNNIPAGAYSFTVTDINGCSEVSNGLVNDIAGAVVSVTSQTNVSCFGLMNGAATTTLTGGTGPYTYMWSGPTSSTLSSLSNAGAGLYNLMVSDVSGCIGTTNVNITQPTQLVALLASWTAPCIGICNGTAVLNVTGGTGAYSYTWTGGAGNTSSIANLCPGNYGFTITDANNCVTTNSISITQMLPLNILSTYTNASCGGSCDGAAFAAVPGGQGITSYLWLPTLQTGTNAYNLCAGIHTIQVTTSTNTCVDTKTLVISNQGATSISNATLSTNVINETCLNTGDGAINLTISGTNPGPFTYQWSNGATTQDITNASSGSYNVVVYDAGLNCMSISSSVSAIGTNCGSISGNIFIDNNNDCIKNAGDNNSSNTQIIANPGNRIGYTNFNGDYVFYNLPFGNYTITANTNTVTMQSTCGTNSLTTTINSTTPNSINNNFVREIIPPTQPDLYVSAYSIGIVPGFVCRMNYLLHNYNTFNANGILKVTLPSAFIPNITNAFPAAYTVSGDTVIWNFTNINYMGANVNFYIDFTTPLNTPLGSTFMTCMWAQPTVTDANYTNNNFCYQRPVTGSFDPNDKTVSPVGVGANRDISATETDLTYLIRFQNTGNGPAVNIVVKDTLSPNVDINTFEMLSSSHNYMIDVLPGNILRWKFNNIMLPDSNSNEPGSHGYIQYRIKRNNNNTPGTQIKNTAYIYFDFNEPVVTNTAINTIETITGIKSSFNTNDGWNVYPNPSTGVLYIVNSSAVKEESQIQVINSIGQTVLEETITSNYKNVDLSKLNNGVYFVKIVSDKQSVIKRVVLSR